MNCLECGAEVGLGGRRGRSPKYCCNACRQKAYRSRKLASDAPVLLTVESFPDAMASVTNWVRADGKRPIRVDGRGASSTSPASWSSLPEVLATDVGDGFGFMLGHGSGVGCHDLDNALDADGRLVPWAEEVLAGIESPVFVEVSQSSRGLHVFVEAAPVPGSKKVMPNGGRHEFYSKDRFIRTTGKVFKGF